jgi:anti-anti-sigma factor
MLCAAGEIVVLRVVGEVDLCTLPVLRAALGAGLAAHPAHLLVDLTAMTFCCARGLDLLTQTAHTTAGKATSFAVSGVSPQIARIWTLGWDGDLPSGYRSTAAAMTAIPGCQVPADIRSAQHPRVAVTELHHWRIVIVLGFVLLVAGFLLAIPILWTFGIILVVVGLILELLGALGHAVGGRRHYY